MTKKQKHLTLEDRIDIQTGISQQETFRSISCYLSFSRTTDLSSPMWRSLSETLMGSLTSTSATLAVLTRRGGLRRTIRFCELFFPRVLPLTS